jgi:hypothetical protein
MAFIELKKLQEKELIAGFNVRFVHSGMIYQIAIFR